MLAAQGGSCAICNQTCQTGKRLAVDHCHATKKIRGLLCQGCNTSLGKLKDSPATLVAAVNYLCTTSNQPLPTVALLQLVLDTTEGTHHDHSSDRR